MVVEVTVFWVKLAWMSMERKSPKNLWSVFENWGLDPKWQVFEVFRGKMMLSNQMRLPHFQIYPWTLYIYTYIYIDLIILEHGVSQNDDTTMLLQLHMAISIGTMMIAKKHGFRQTRFIRYQTRCTYYFIYIYTHGPWYQISTFFQLMLNSYFHWLKTRNAKASPHRIRDRLCHWRGRQQRSA